MSQDSPDQHMSRGTAEWSVQGSKVRVRYLGLDGVNFDRRFADVNLANIFFWECVSKIRAAAVPTQPPSADEQRNHAT